jgi:hypothetical protein
MSNLKERAAAAAKAAVQRKPVETMGLAFEVRGMMAGDSLRVNDARERGGDAVAGPLMVAICTYDPETGEQVWNPNDMLDLQAVGALPPEAFNDLCTAGGEASGLLGKSKSTETTSSPSTSPASSEGAPSPS